MVGNTHYGTEPAVTCNNFPSHVESLEKITFLVCLVTKYFTQLHKVDRFFFLTILLNSLELNDLKGEKSNEASL